VTLTEPNSYLAAGYLLGLRPPYRKSYRAFAISAYNLVKAHETTYGILKQKVDHVSVGVAHSIFWVNAQDPRSLADRAMAGATRAVTAYLSPRLLRPCDFIGVNFFYGMEARFNPRGRFWKSEIYPDAEAVNMPRRLPFGAELIRPKGFASDSGWPVTPDLFLEALEATHRRFAKPIIVTSNGISDRTDAIRPYYLLSHLVAIAEAIARHVDIRGYFHWTAVTNREWEDGMNDRTDYGLIRVDPETGAREIRPSAGMLGQIAAAGRIEAGQFARYLTPEQQPELDAFDARIRLTRQRAAAG
jgi:beta-glucosidase